MILLVALINLVPVAGLFSSASLVRLYGIDPADDTLLLLLGHRALLFGVLGGFVLLSLFQPQYRHIAMIMASVSMAGFMMLAWPYAALAQSVRTIFIGDLIGMFCLLIWGSMVWLRSRSPG